jgi:hypothetical protein
MQYHLEYKLLFIVTPLNQSYKMILSQPGTELGRSALHGL